MRPIISFVVNHTTTVLIAVLTIFLFGSYAYVTLPREASPDITIPVVLVTTPYIGVSPRDVETLLTIPLERELASLRDVKVMKSTSAEGVSIVSIEFEPGTDIEDALQKVRDRVSKAKPDLPTDAEETSIREISFSDLPILYVNLAGGVDEEALKKIAEEIEDEVTRIAGVLDAKVTGGKTREIRVQIDPDRLSHYGLSLNDVVGAIRDENVNIPGGTVTTGRGNFLLRVPGQFHEPTEIEGVAVKRVGDRPVFVKDLGRVVDSYKDRETYSRMNGVPSVTLSITKRAGANILEIADAIKAQIAEDQKHWPEGVSYRILGDQSKQIALSVADLQNNIISSLLLVVAVIIFFMGVRNSLFVGISIPLSMLMSLAVLQLMGVTLNMVVLFSLMLALGMLVDNAIVVVENIYRHMEMGKTSVEASIDGTTEVGIAVAASTATTVAAFFPLLFWGGIMGEFMGFLPLTVIVVLTSSLVVSVGILPVFTALLMAKPKSAGTGEELLVTPVESLGFLMRLYRHALLFSIRFRYLTLFAGGLAFVGTLIIYVLLNHGTEFFPATSPDRAIVAVDGPEGTDIEETDRIVRRIEAVLAKEPNVDVWVAETGVSGTGNALAGSQAAPAEARITVDFLPHPSTAMPGEKLRVESTELTIDRLRVLLKEIPGAKVTVAPEETGPPVGDPIAVEVSGADFETVGLAAQRISRELAKIPGVTGLSDDYVTGRPELRLRIDRGAAKRVGVSSAQVGDAVRNAVAGTKASALRDGEDEYDIMVELSPEARGNLQSVLGLRLPGREDTSPSTFPVPLSAVAAYELAGGSGSVKHVDQDLVVTIKGDVLDGFNENDVREAVAEKLKTINEPGVKTKIAGSQEEQEQAVAFLGKAFAIAVILILAVLVLQFDSLSMPFIILCTVVLSLIGVLWGLLLTGTPFGVIMTGIGVISLAGVVVNNAIVLLDYVQQLIDRGLSVREALVEAGLTRFRPVMLTAITTGLGLLPMALAISIDFFRFSVVVGAQSAQMWGPMAVAVIFGLGFATVLTLLMVPTLYSIYDDFGGLYRRFTKGAPAPAAEEVTDPGGAGVVAWAVPLLVVALGMSGPAQAATLSEVFASAEENNVDLKLLEEQTFQTGLNRTRAWSALSPRLSAQGQYVINSFESVIDFSSFIPEGINLPASDPIVVQRRSFFSANAQLSQRLFSGSAVPGLNAAYAMTRSAEQQERAQRDQIRLALVQLVYQVETARASEELAESSLIASGSQLELAERQVAAGMQAERAVLQAKLAQARAKRDVDQAHEGRLTAELAFARMTGMPADTTLELPEQVEVPADLEAAIKAAHEQRADLQGAAYTERAAQHQRTAQDLQWLPTVDGSFAVNYSQNLGFQPTNTTWQVALVANWSLWDGGLRLADSRDRASQVRAAKLQAERMHVEAEEEIRVSYAAWVRAEEALRSVEAELGLARENLRMAEAGFSAGTTTWLDVEQAQLGVKSSELNLLRERATRDISAWKLRVATGSSGA